jgi:hypothetical protein
MGQFAPLVAPLPPCTIVTYIFSHISIVIAYYLLLLYLQPFETKNNFIWLELNAFLVSHLHVRASEIFFRPNLNGHLNHEF